MMRQMGRRCGGAVLHPMRPHLHAAGTPRLPDGTAYCHCLLPLAPGGERAAQRFYPL